MGILATLFMLQNILSPVSYSAPRGLPWKLSWPFFQNAQAPYSVIEGYGDWCVASEGLHPGIDLYSGLAVNLVLNPFDRCPDSSLYAKGFFPREGV